MGRDRWEGGETKASGQTSRARVPGDLELLAASQHTTHKERVRFVIGMMSADEWPEYPESMPFRTKLAGVWGITESTVRNITAEASNFLKMDPVELEQARIALAKRCRRIADDASTSYNHITGLCDYKSELDALDRFAKYMGIDAEKVAPTSAAPVKVEIVYASPPDEKK